jgi:hypothetical protein
MPVIVPVVTVVINPVTAFVFTGVVTAGVGITGSPGIVMRCEKIS